jgi:hypothetical protein
MTSVLVIGAAVCFSIAGWGESYIAKEALL